MQVRGVLGDHRDGLHAGGAGADHADPPALEVHGLVWPASGVMALAGERVEARDVGRVGGGGEQTQPGDEEPGDDGVTGAGLHPPRAVRVVVPRGLDAGAEADVTQQVEALGDVLEVGEDLRLARVLAAPLPLLQQLFGEGVPVHVALGVAARSRVPVEVPGAADPVRRLDHYGPQAEHVTHPVQHVETGETGPHDHDVHVHVHAGRSGHCAHLWVCWGRLSPSRTISAYMRPMSRAAIGPVRYHW